VAVALAPDDIVRTHEESVGNAREPLLVIEPLRAYLKQSALNCPRQLWAHPIGDGH
jgi:hypothetical protein